MEQIIKNRYRILVIFILAVVGWNMMSVADDDKPGDLDYIQLFSRIFQTIQTRYLEQTDPLVLGEGAIDGMLLINSHYAFLEPVSGSSGLLPARGPINAGMILGYKEPMIRIIDVIPESPADKAGIFPGDNLVRIGDKVTPFLTIDRAERMLSGKPDDTVEIVVQNHLTLSLEEITLTLEKTPPDDSLDFQLRDDGVLVIAIRDMIDGTVVKSIRDRIQSQQKLPGVILDLRHANRGDESAGFRLADLFLTPGQPVATLCSSDNKELEIVNSGESPAFTAFPLVIIIDATSAGPADTCAIALKDTGRAVITGERSFGKAVRLETTVLDEMFNMHVVTGWYDSLDHEPAESGIDPDIPVALPSASPDDPFMRTASSVIESQVGDTNHPGSHR